MSTNSAIIEGTIIHLGEIEQKSEKFKMRLVVIRTAGQYPQEIPVQFTKANVDKSQALRIGDAVNISCNLRGREWSSKWYLSLDAWRVELSATQPTAPAPTPTAPKPVQDAPKIATTADVNYVEDLPF